MPERNRLSERQNCLIPKRLFLALALFTTAALCADFTFEIPPVSAPLEIGGQTVTITLAGELSASPQAPGPGDQTFNFNLRADLGDLQNKLTPILQAELNKSERCGDRISLQSASLAPVPPTANLALGVHFEKWICIKSLGDAAKKLTGGDATIHVILTPHLENTESGVQSVRLDADIATIEADGPLGEALRSGSVGAALRDKIRQAMLKALQKSTDLAAVMPAPIRRFVAMQKISFADAGFGRPALDIAGQLKVPGEAVSTVLEEFGNR